MATSSLERTSLAPEKLSSGAKQLLERVLETAKQSLAQEQSRKFSDTNEITGRLIPGFSDPGRVRDGYKIRETLIWDPDKDKDLRMQIKEIKAKTEGLSAERKISVIMQFVFSKTGKDKVAFHKPDNNSERRLMLGSIEGEGVCRHRAELFQGYAGECGVGNQSSLVRGFLRREDKSHAHIWNEVRVRERTYVVDLANLPPEVVRIFMNNFTPEPNQLFATLPSYQHWEGQITDWNGKLTYLNADQEIRLASGSNRLARSGNIKSSL